LWQRYLIGMGFSSAVTDAMLVPDFFVGRKQPRYYQRIAIDAAIPMAFSPSPSDTTRRCSADHSFSKHY